jgi:hypothetical protein
MVCFMVQCSGCFHTVLFVLVQCFTSDLALLVSEVGGCGCGWAGQVSVQCLNAQNRHP